MNDTKLICAKCHNDWHGSGSPTTCPDCKQISVPISVPKGQPNNED